MTTPECPYCEAPLWIFDNGLDGSKLICMSDECEESGEPWTLDHVTQVSEHKAEESAQAALERYAERMMNGEGESSSYRGQMINAGRGRLLS